jgi:serine/threonine protein kinase
VSTPAEEIPEGLPQVGETLAGKYTIKRLIACGGMGAVYEVHHEILDQAVALKVLLPEAKEHSGATARFINEARASARIRNEHVAQVMDVGKLDNGSVYIVLELLRGSDLARLLEQRGRLPVEEAVDYTLQALEGLAEAHALGIVHRDLKPANLFLAQREKGAPLIKVLDFGISKVIGGPERKQHGDPVTDSRALLGSPSYMSPEQVRSSKHIDARSDIWSVGVILYRLIAYQPPFEGDNLGTVLAAILESTPTPLRQHRPEVPEGLERVILRCLDRNRDTRYQSVDELAEALMPFAPSRARYSLDRIRSTLGAVSQRAPSPSDTGPTAGPALAESNGGKTAESWSESQRTKRPASSRVALLAMLGVVVLGAGAIALVFRSSASSPTSPVSEESKSAAAVPAAYLPTPSVTPVDTVTASAEPVVAVAPVVPSASAVTAPSASARTKAAVRAPVRAAKPGLDDSVLFNRK